MAQKTKMLGPDKGKKLTPHTTSQKKEASGIMSDDEILALQPKLRQVMEWDKKRKGK